MFLGILIISVTCIVDDIKTIKPITKLIGQVLAAIITVGFGVRIEDIKLPEGFYLKETGILNEIGTFTYKAVYRPSNPNYNTVEDIEITIEVEKANPSVATPNDIILEKENGFPSKTT